MQHAKQPVYVLFTMDCERIAAESPTGGPATWEIGERAVRGYTDTLLSRGYPATLFLIPECAAYHADLFRSVAARGVELGLHVHTHSLLDHRYTRYLGEYDAATQHEIIGLSADIVTEAIGRRPTSYRSGNASASNDTYPVLYELGFRQSSCADPGRYVPQFHADWRGAEPDPHYVNPEDKLRAGELPLFEAPITTNPDRLQPNGFPYELRIESGPFAAWHQPILEQTLSRWERDDVGFRALCIFTHNVFLYDDPAYEGSVTLRDLLDTLDDLADRYQVIPVTLAEAHTHYRAHLAQKENR